MTIIQLLILITVFLVTSIISVVTGSTSLITVPAMLQLGIEPRSAIATNMFALTLMSIGGTLPFLGKNKIDRNRLPLLIVLTLAGSILGALLSSSAIKSNIADYLRLNDCFRCFRDR